MAASLIRRIFAGDIAISTAVSGALAWVLVDGASWKDGGIPRRIWYTLVLG